MKVLFLKHVINVWKPWEIKEVKSGYASNMLFPKGLAVEFSDKIKKDYENKKKKEEKQKQELVENRHILIEKLNQQKLEFSLKTWANDKVFGAISEKDIINSIKKKFKINLTKKHIVMHDWHIKKLWESQIYVKLGEDSMAKIIIILKWE